MEKGKLRTTSRTHCAVYTKKKKKKKYYQIICTYIEKVNLYILELKLKLQNELRCSNDIEYGGITGKENLVAHK